MAERAMRIEAVLFDIDGTLLDHESASTASLQARRWRPSVAALDAATHDEALAEWRRLEELHYETYLSGEIDGPEQRRRRAAGILEWLGAPARPHPELDSLVRALPRRLQGAVVAVRRRSRDDRGARVGGAAARRDHQRGRRASSAASWRRSGSRRGCRPSSPPPRSAGRSPSRRSSTRRAPCSACPRSGSPTSATGSTPTPAAPAMPACSASGSTGRARRPGYAARGGSGSGRGRDADGGLGGRRRRPIRQVAARIRAAGLSPGRGRTTLARRWCGRASDRPLFRDSRTRTL